MTTVVFQLGDWVKLTPTTKGGRDGHTVKVTGVSVSPSGVMQIDYTDPRHGGCRTVPATRVQRVVRPPKGGR